MRNEVIQIVDPMLYKEAHAMKATLRRALEVAFICVREDAYARPTISEVVEALDYIVKHTSSKQKSIDLGRGGSLEKTRTVISPNKGKRMLTVDEEEEEEDEETEALQRKRAVAEAKFWAISSRHSTKPPSVHKSGEIEEIL